MTQDNTTEQTQVHACGLTCRDVTQFQALLRKANMEQLEAMYQGIESILVVNKLKQMRRQ